MGSTYSNKKFLTFLNKYDLNLIDRFLIDVESVDFESVFPHRNYDKEMVYSFISNFYLSVFKTFLIEMMEGSHLDREILPQEIEWVEFYLDKVWKRSSFKKEIQAKSEELWDIKNVE